MLQVENLSATYGPVVAVRNVSFELEEGETLALIGPNGAGKSSLLGALYGIVHQSSGQIKLHGKIVNNLRPEERTSLGMSLVPEGRRIFGTVTVKENLLLGGARFGIGPRGNKRAVSMVSEVIDIFPELKPHLSKPAQTLSGGQQQMLAIGRALVSEPDLMLLDEPSLGLAPIIVDRIFDLLTEIKNRKHITVLLVEQNAFRAIDYAERTIILRNGEIVLQGDRNTLTKDKNLARDFLGHSSRDGSA